ncbi:hypothetical protein [Roseofilum casamattae]|uniref:Uncharacterized protein n=1 Tax=Roseofilum casamattae BLCC-M143 TaxID=3022442 RepID=A0ABT7BWU0_9CYAN|nr:hypothetical protein [Roseofilum casamattae]MDJ1183660.1 hypothetical protein [Roseofilum casamattae BLCC-M143]
MTGSGRFLLDLNGRKTLSYGSAIATDEVEVNRNVITVSADHRLRAPARYDGGGERAGYWGKYRDGAIADV